MTEELKSAVYNIEVTASLAYMDPKYRFQNASYNSNNKRFFVNKGAAGYKSVSIKSVRVISKVS